MAPLNPFSRSGRPELDPAFDAAAANAAKAAQLLDVMLRDWPDADLLAEITACEHEGDRLTAAIASQPGQSAEMVALASTLDDVCDYAEEVADCMGLYRIEAPMDQALGLASVLAQAAASIALAVTALRAGGDASEHTQRIHDLENEGDRLEREALASLFEYGTDPMLVIRWKDLFERLEEGIDATERVANLLQGLSTRLL
jgi:uncharacterized protein Yka (UPF0111/DUF47 family)